MKQIISVKELQEELSISRATIYRYMEQGMPSLKVGRLVRFEREVVLKWFKDRSARS